MDPNPETVVTPSAEAVAIAQQTFTIEVLKVVREAQMQHGLRHADYQRYRTYCSRRLKRVRHTLHFSCGNMRRFQKRELTADDLVDSRYLLIPLFQAERAWAYSMQLKQESNSETRKRFHLLNRLRKAIKYARELEKLCQLSKCDARAKLEAQGYASVLNGQFFFERQEWDKSLSHFALAKAIYEKLSAALVGDDAHTFYVQRVEEIVPNIRYCNYNLGDESARKELIDMKLKGFELSENIDVIYESLFFFLFRL
jgi:signal recognition particle subunit SRP68